MQQNSADETDEDVFIAHICIMAYGPNVSLQDAVLVTDWSTRAALQKQCKRIPAQSDAYGKLVDVLAAHKDDFSRDEQRIIADALVGLSKLHIGDRVEDYIGDYLLKCEGGMSNG